jgi:Ni/Fe-hydrogenase subunit HybB-like protein
MTHYNFKSIFAWNMMFYNGFFAIVGLYLLTMMDRKLHGLVQAGGFHRFPLADLALTTATGSIFGFIVARAGYNSALMAPMFIIMSFAYGLASSWWCSPPCTAGMASSSTRRIRRRMKNLLAVFVAASLYFNIVFHLTNLYFAKQWDYERFILLDGGIYTWMFWVGQVILGGIIPIILLFIPRNRDTQAMCFCFLAPSWSSWAVWPRCTSPSSAARLIPLSMFPGHAVSSSFFDGVVAAYSPSIWEWMLGLGGVGIAFVATVIAVRMPSSSCPRTTSPSCRCGAAPTED